MSLISTRVRGNDASLPAVLPSLTSALSRRRAIFGAVALAAAPAAVQAAPAPILSANDARLIAMAADLRTIRAETAALIKGDRRDCRDIPGFLALEERLFAIADALFEVSPDGLSGLVAASDIVQQLADENGGDEFKDGHGHNLACDVLRIIGGVP